MAEGLQSTSLQSGGSGTMVLRHHPEGPPPKPRWSEMSSDSEEDHVRVGGDKGAEQPLVGGGEAEQTTSAVEPSAATTSSSSFPQEKGVSCGSAVRVGDTLHLADFPPPQPRRTVENPRNSEGPRKRRRHGGRNKKGAAGRADGGETSFQPPTQSPERTGPERSGEQGNSFVHPMTNIASAHPSNSDLLSLEQAQEGTSRLFLQYGRMRSMLWGLLY